jgi:hypothetical protein
MTKEEKIMIVKQLGMMHVLYRAKKNVMNTLTKYESLTELYKRTGKTIEDSMLSWIEDEERLIYYLDNWEKAFFHK